MSGVIQKNCRNPYGDRSLFIMREAQKRGLCLLSNGKIKLPSGKVHNGTPQCGRDRINLSIDGDRITIQTARVVCFLAHGAPPSLNSVVDHIDGDTLNDDPSNLRWASYSENTRNTVYSRSKTWEQKAIEACAGMPDPAAEIAALRASLREIVEYAEGYAFHFEDVYGTKYLSDLSQMRSAIAKARELIN